MFVEGPTGCGKTVIIGKIFSDYRSGNLKIPISNQQRSLGRLSVARATENLGKNTSKPKLKPAQRSDSLNSIDTSKLKMSAAVGSDSLSCLDTSKMSVATANLDSKTGRISNEVTAEAETGPRKGALNSESDSDYENDGSSVCGVGDGGSCRSGGGRRLLAYLTHTHLQMEFVAKELSSVGEKCLVRGGVSQLCATGCGASL